MADAQKVVGIAGLITVGVGAGNAIFKEKRPPSSRFLIGVGVAFFVLSALAEFDGSDEIAKGLALGVMTTVLLSDETGGVLRYLNTGELDIPGQPKKQATGRQIPQVTRTIQVQRPGAFRPDGIPQSLIPGLTAPGALPLSPTPPK